MSSLRIHNFDTLFFRDGKPFTMAEDNWADSLFPPMPSVIYGALRTACATTQGKEVSFSKIEKELNLHIDNISYRIKGSDYLPMPLDFVEPKKKKDTDEKERIEKNREKREKSYIVERLFIKEKPLNFFSSADSFKLLLPSVSTKQVESLENALFSQTDIKTYLNGHLKESKCLKIKDWVKSEPKLGIGRNKSSRTTEEGKLYRVGMNRLDEFDIIVNFSDSQSIYNHQDIKNSIVRLGGEGKLIQFIDARQGFNIDSNTVKFNKGKFKIYLSTPTIFDKNDWQPNLEKIGINAKLVAACIGKPKNVGGFDITEGQPHKMYKAVPAGSVYFYETDDDLTILGNKQGISVSDIWAERGFGIAYFGTY
jgi:CRISPR-associated protein Cmr3